MQKQRHGSQSGLREGRGGEAEKVDQGSEVTGDHIHLRGRKGTEIMLIDYDDIII